jgi:hypothetical protein
MGNWRRGGRPGGRSRRPRRVRRGRVSWGVSPHLSNDLSKLTCFSLLSFSFLVTAESGTATRSSARGASPSGPASTAIKPKTVKYPIEDLLLEASSIHDGRILRRSNAPPPPLPSKPQGSRALPLPKEVWDKTVETWSMLNVFACVLLPFPPFAPLPFRY